MNFQLTHLAGVSTKIKRFTGQRAPYLNIWLNEEACWGQVPAAVWATTLGGYPVLKKWLSYRAAPVLARDLLLPEVQEFTRLVRRLAALRALAPALDNSYAASQAPPPPVVPLH